MTKEQVIGFVKDSIVNNCLTYSEFERIFWFVSLKEQYEIVNHLINANIKLVENIEMEAEESNQEITDSLLIDLEDIWSDDNDGFTDEKKNDTLSNIVINENVKQSNETLCELIRQGNKQAEQDLCIKNKRLVAKYASAYHKLKGNKLEYDDLEQSGMLGLIKAAKKFDIQRGNAFSTYAVYWIQQSINREIADHGFTVRLPVHVMEKIAKVEKIDKRLAMEGIEFSERKKEIAQEMEMSISMVEQCFQLRNEYLSIKSLDVPVGEDEDTTLLELIEASDYMSPEKIVEENELRESLWLMIDDLKDRERAVIIKRFGLENGRPMTLEAVGEEFNVTRERIRQIEAKALKKLGNPVRSKKIKDYL